MPEGELEIAYCHACGASMDVTAVAPFSNVECPGCGKHTRVKREFGPYTLLRRHAVGGMSVVFIAQDNTLGREVVVKILNEDYGSDDKRITAFEEEARITASFSHPHVVRVFTTGRAFDRFYIAMELVPGGHFEHHIRERGSIPEQEVLPLAIQIAAGLKAAHGAGLIHRDMKPGNILLDAAGNAKIVDFGLALVTKGGKAQAAEIWATPYYVPPETIEGLEEDFRSDIYAFGATLYHALAGKPSCNEESMDTNRLREAKRKIPPLAKAAPWVSAATCAVVDRAMAYEPAQRFRSYDDLSAALESARQQLASGVSLPSPATSRRESSRTGENIALVAACLLVIGALAFGGWWVMQPEEPVAGPAPPPVVKIPDVPDTSAAIGSTYREAGEALLAGDHAKARGLFRRVRDQAGVLEPTGSWAACEAVICSYLEGQPAEARGDARAALLHLEKAEGLDPAVRERLAAVLEKTEALTGIEGPGEKAESGAGLLEAMIAGLKNWEHGMPRLALPFFEAVIAADASGADRWVEPYQEIATAHLNDARRLEAAELDELPQSEEACLRLMDELHELRVALETKGRARFNVGARLSELEKRARQLANAPTPEPEPPSPVTLADVRHVASECRFSEASAMLKAPGFGLPGDAESAAVLLLTEAATAFLAELEEDLESPPAELDVESRDGSRLGGVVGAHPGGLVVAPVDGSARKVPWSELSPTSVIDLHRELVKNEGTEIERLRRHEQAIAFDLLAGEPERAVKAADELAARAPAFRRRWEQVRPALQ